MDSGQIIKSFPQKKILVIGDVMLDKYLHAQVSRVSPEAPVPVAHVKRESFALGGAANVAANIQSLGGKSILCGLIGNDLASTQLIDVAKSLGIDTSGLIQSASQTIQKIRVIGGNQQLLRIDYEDVNNDSIDTDLSQKDLLKKEYLFSILRPSVGPVTNLSDEGEVSNPGFDIDKTLSWRFPDGERRLSQSDSQHEEMLNKYKKDISQRETSQSESSIISFLKTVASSVDVILISDYNKGVLSKPVVDFLKTLKKLIIVDPKPEHIDWYKDCFLVKFGRAEAESVTKIKDDSEDNASLICHELHSRLNSHIILTRASDGVALFENNNLISIPTQAKEVYDVTGAGDTMIASLALAIASGATIQEAAIISNSAAGIKVGKRGTAQVTSSELIQVYEKEHSKIKSWDEIHEIGKSLHSNHKKIVFTNGCFDILHVGHINLLNKAKTYGDILILGLNTDASVHRLKGPSRPVVPENDRAEVLSALSCIDYIVFFDQDTPFEIIQTIQPDYIVKGGDYIPETVVGKGIVEARGGKVIIFPSVLGRSTTKIIEKSRNG